MEGLIRTGDSSALPAVDAPGYPHAPIGLQPQVDVRRVWRALANRKLLILLITLAVSIPVALYSFLTPPTYLATAVIQIDPEAVKVLPYTSISDSLVSAPADFELYMKTQDEVLRSPALAARTLERLREKLGGAEMPLLKSGFESGLGILRVHGSQIVRISYVSHDPDFSAMGANTLVEEFIKLHIERKADTTRKASEFLQNQLAALKQKVESAEAEMIRYAARHNILGIGGNQENVIRQRLGILNAQVTDAEKEYISKKAAFEEIRRVAVETFPGSLRTPEIASLETRVLQAEQELSGLLSQFGENWPAVVRKKQELAVLRQQLLDSKHETLDRAKRDAENRFETARNQYEMLSQTLREQQELVNRLNEASIRYNTLKRDVEAGDQLYQGLLQRLKETGVSASLEFGNIHVTDPAVPVRTPYRPRPAWNISLSVILGLAAGVFLAFFLEYLDRSLRNPADLEAMGIPLLGWVPVFSERREERTALPGNRKNGRILLQMSAPSAAGSLVPAVAPVTTWDLRARESYRSIFASLLLSRAEKPARSILVTSAIPREGKTTMLANLGATLAETGVRTLLIDGDFRNPSLSCRFGVGNGKGLSIYLAGGELDIRQTSLEELFILPAGPFPPNPVALLASTRFTEALVKLQQEFRFILIDSPPVLSVADALIVAAKVDGVILVVKTGDTPRDIISRANLQLLRSGARILGAAANFVDLRNPEYHYYRKYYSDKRYTQNDRSRRPA